MIKPGSVLVKDVLLAEDDEDDVYLFREAVKLIDSSLLIRQARDGNVLMLLLQEKMPDILFLDICMPCKEGISCIVEIRKNPAYDKLPIVVYSSIHRDTIIEEAYINGANYYVTKAANFDAIVDKLKRIFSVNWEKNLFYPDKDEFVV